MGQYLCRVPGMCEGAPKRNGLLALFYCYLLLVGYGGWQVAAGGL